MNLDQLSAMYLDDKALMECNSTMSTALLRTSSSGVEVGPGMLCRPTHQHHPVTLWVGATRSNFAWCFAHAVTLIEEWQNFPCFWISHRIHTTVHRIYSRTAPDKV